MKGKIIAMSENTDSLRFSEDALSNRVLFLSSFNDVNIYVEDVGKEYEYEAVFERLFENAVKVFAIFPLGGKMTVIRECRNQGMKDTTGKLNIFIVDGDFDNLWDDQKVELPNLIYLTRYNIENYYLDDNTIANYMRMHLKQTRSETEEKIKLNEWKEHFSKSAGSLFVLFSLVQRFCLPLPNVGSAVGKFLDRNGYVIAEEYQEFRKVISSNLGEVTHLEREIQKRISEICEGPESHKIFSVICGKFQIESICRYLSFRGGKNVNRTDFKNNLISNFDITSLNFLKYKILDLVATELAS